MVNQRLAYCYVRHDRRRKFLADNNLEASMSRKGNCHDNAAVVSVKCISLIQINLPAFKRCRIIMGGYQIAS